MAINRLIKTATVLACIIAIPVVITVYGIVFDVQVIGDFLPAIDYRLLWVIAGITMFNLGKGIWR